MRISADELDDKLARYGHSAVAAPDDDTGTLKMFIFGGFSGTTRHDVIKLTPASECNSQVYTQKECTDDANGIRCVLVGKKCVVASASLSYRQSFNEFIKTDSPKLQERCPGNGNRHVKRLSPANFLHSLDKSEKLLVRRLGTVRNVWDGSAA